jgi:hypothetical protein
MATRMQQRRGTAAQWAAANPVLGAGEIGFETDTNKFKVGNGSTAFASLQYFVDASIVFDSSEVTTAINNAIDAVIDAAPNTLNTLNEIAAAIGDDAGFANSITQNLANIQNVLTQQSNTNSSLSNSIASTNNALSVLDQDHYAVKTSVENHANATSNVHGIINAFTLVYDEDLDVVSNSLAGHESATSNVHGISNVFSLVYDEDLVAVSNSLADHESGNTSVHGISNTLNLVYTNDSRLSDERTPVSDSVTTAKIANAAVTGPKIADNAISQSHLSDDSVGTNELGGLSVTTEKLANAAVTTAKIAEGAVTKTMVGLSDVDNTSDANKPVSSATQTALDLKANLAGPTFTGTTTVDALTVDGNLTVNGNTFAVSSTSITVEDNILQLAHENPANTIDLGLVVAYNDGTAKHSGLVRDASDAKWKLFKGVTTEPTTTIDFTEGSLDDIKVAALEATTVTPSSGVVFPDGTQTKEGVPSRTPIISKTASYTLSAESERDSLIEVSSESGTTITIPLNSAVAYPVGTTLDILQTNTGQVTIAGDAGVTVNATPGLKLRTRWSSATLFKRAENSWVVFGDLSA